MMKSRIARSFSALAIVPVLLTVHSCATTGLGRSWADPAMQGHRFTRLAVVALTKQEVYRMQAEDELVAEMPNGVASHAVLPGLNSLRDTAAAAAALRTAGCDGVVILRLKSGAIKIDPNVPPKPAASVGQDMNDYWVDPSAQETHSFAPGQYFAVDVRVYDLVRNKMAWTGLAVEQDAHDVGELMRKVRADVIKDLRKRGFVAGEKQ